MYDSKIKNYVMWALVLSIFALSVSAQTTEFTYQGKLVDNSVPATANYDFEFRLWDAVTGGSSLGLEGKSNVAVTNGSFTANLDFGNRFTGPPRWLEISVKPAGGGSFTTLVPRQPVTSSPYSIKSANATTADTATTAATAANSMQLGGVNANQYVITTDGRLSDPRPPTAGSGNYIQNTPATVQANTNFNISGNGNLGGSLSANSVSANIVTSATQFNIGFGSRVLGIAGLGNLFVGAQSGNSNTGSNNAFVGAFSGSFNTTGTGNSFFGRSAGQNNTTGKDNSFFGHNAGLLNTANANSFFGSFSGESNTSGLRNSFFGAVSGNSNTTGNDNSFFGHDAGFANTASHNSFFGSLSGNSNTSGLRNSFFGASSGSSNTTGNDNSYFGYAVGSNTQGSFNSYFGSLINVGFVDTGSENSFFGYKSGFRNQDGESNTYIGALAGSNSTGSFNTFIGTSAGDSLNQTNTGSNNTLLGYNADLDQGNLSYATAIGAGAIATFSNQITLGRSNGADSIRIPGNAFVNENAFIAGTLRVDTLAAGGSQDICRAGGIIDQNKLSVCSSSLRFKSDIQPFTSGLESVKRLRPITFVWKNSGTLDIGFAAEEVAEVEPLLATYNAQGEIEGVKYKQITTVLVNAVNQQQTQIEAQKVELEKQRAEIETLKRLFVLQNHRPLFVGQRRNKSKKLTKRACLGAWPFEQRRLIQVVRRATVWCQY